MSKIIRDIPFEMQGEYKREASFSREEIDQIIDYLIQKHDINIDDIQKVVELTDFGTQSLVIYLSKKYNTDESRMVHLDFINNSDGISIDFKMPENIVKATAKELGLKYRELGEAIGYSEDAIAKAASTNKVSESMQKALELLLEVNKLNKEKQDVETLKTSLQKLLNL